MKATTYAVLAAFFAGGTVIHPLTGFAAGITVSLAVYNALQAVITVVRERK